MVEPDKIKTPEQVDRVVSAELPYPISKPAFFDIVKRCMLHGPCERRNQGAQCMENNFCKKGYSKPWAETTSIDDDGYLVYCRRDNGLVLTMNGKQLDHKDVIPYNPYLIKIFNGHINVEVCARLRCVKYIHKYIYKGHDQETIVLGRGDEIKQYLDVSYVGPLKAPWWLFGNILHEEFPNGQHNVLYDSRCSQDQIGQEVEEKVTKLIVFFQLLCFQRNGPRFNLSTNAKELHVAGKILEMKTS